MKAFVRPVRTALITFVAVVLSVAGMNLSMTTASATPLPPSTPTGLPAGIESLARYVGQSACDPRQWPGTTALARQLVGRFPDTSYNTTYTCGTDGSRSEHYDGRAIDWMVSARSTTQSQEAAATIKWMLATDKAGHTYALARRMGIMYIIWNGQIWGSYSQKWEPYQNCLDASMLSTAHDSYCHRNHVHISLSWNGALARTSYFSKKVFDTTDYGQCPVNGMNWSADYKYLQTTRCIRYGTFTAPAGSSGVYINLLKYSGAAIGLGDRGPIVSAIQAALNKPQTGYFDDTTRVALLAWQQRRSVPGGGRTSIQTWQRMLFELKPR